MEDSNDVFVADDEPSQRSAQIQCSVKSMLKRIEAADASTRQQSKRSRESTGSQGDRGERSLMERFEEVISLIKQESKNQRDVIIKEIKNEFSAALREIESKLDAVKTSLEKRVIELEQHVNERDCLIERMENDLIQSKTEIANLQQEAEEREMAWRAPELILSGKSVPPPARPDSARDRPSEDLRRTASDVIRRAFPRAEVDLRDFADVRRIGGRVLLCRFVSTGPGSLRHYLFENRMLLKGKPEQSELFISESLTPKNKDILNHLLELKKAKKLYCVFTRFGHVYCKLKRELQRIPVNSLDKVNELRREQVSK